MKKKLCVLLMIFAFGLIHAQWPSDAAENVVVCTDAADQVLVKIAATSDGGCYIGWLDMREATTYYATYLQRLDPQGNTLWQDDGILISGHPTMSWTTDWDMGVDNDDNCMIIINDERDGNLDIFAYLISPEQEFLWGADGVALSTTWDFEPSPKITATADGNYVAFWQGDDDGIVQKLNAAGEKQWGEDGVVLLHEGNVSYTPLNIVASDNDNVIIVYKHNEGSYPSYDIELHARKLDGDGNFLWDGDPVVITANNGIPFYTMPSAKSDGEGGAFAYWYDDDDGNMSLSVWVQHVNAAGELQFPVGGTEGANNDAGFRVDPVISYDAYTQNTYMFWAEKNSAQSMVGIYGQRISETGQRLWGDHGLEIMTLGNDYVYMVDAMVMGGNAVCFFDFGIGNYPDTEILNAFALDENGDEVWGEEFTPVSNASGGKDRPQCSQTPEGCVLLTWADGRSGSSSDVYAQNINPNGELGIVAMPYIEITSPEDGAQIDYFPFEVEFTVENFLVGVGGADGYIKAYIGSDVYEHYSTDPIEMGEMASGAYQLALELVDQQGNSLVPPVADFVDIWIVNGINEGKSIAGKTIGLSNHPNPFNPNTIIEFSLNESSMVNLSIYNIQGQLVKTLVNKEMNSGVHTVAWDGTDINNKCVSSGIYFCSIKNGDKVLTKKIALIK